jgi:hypothetical protein
VSYRSTGLAVLAVVLVVVAIVAVLARQPLVAGVCMLATAFVIYLRETGD